MVNDVEASSVKDEIPHDHLFIVTGLSSTNIEKMGQESPADFEDAIAATGYGKFNVMLMLFSIPGFWAACSITTAPSFIFTRAQCDLNLSLLDMGTVSAMTYGGMLSSGLLWGFLSDTLGRKQIMVWGFLTASLVEVTAAMTQNFAMMLVTRYASGFLFNGPFTVLITYIAELHRTELRARIILLTSLFYTLANVTIPVLAWAMLSHDWTFSYFGNSFVIRSWNLFLLVTALMPFVTGVAFIFMPESPKFLMSRGRNEEAMDIFKRIFALNSGKPTDDYPIKTLVTEKLVQQGSGVEALRGGSAQLKPLFKAPHVKWLTLICVIHAGFMFGNNTLRLWYPQLAAMISSSQGQGLCSAIAPTGAPEVVSDCVTLEPDMMTYFQSAAVGGGTLLTYGIGGAIINRCGKRVVSGFCGLASATLVMLLPFVGYSSSSVMVMMSSVLAFTALSGAALSSICVDLFPTSLRVMALATFLMSGRLGTVVGTVIFPALIDYGCIPPFITIASVLAVCGVACSVIPNTTLKKLE